MIFSDNMRGAFLMMLSMAAFTLSDASMKSLAAEVPLFQAVLIRGVITTGLIFLIGMVRGQIRFKFSRSDWRVVALRTVGEMGATVFFLTALFHMPLANISAILQSLPLAITLAGAVFLGETVGWRRYGAILAGFFGVMLIVRPGVGAFDVYSVYALIAVGFVVLRDLATRRLSPEAPSMTVALIAAFATTMIGAAVTLFSDWQPVSHQAAISLGLAAGFIMAGYLLAVMVMRVGEIAFVAPFRYTGLIWAIFLGIFIFDEYPDSLTLIGSAIVVGMGLYTFYRERKLERRARRAALGQSMH